MKLLDLVKNIDKSEKNEDWVNTEEVGAELNISIPCVQQERLKSYWIGYWLCTDTYVGYKLYFLHDEPVAFSSQTGRKSQEKFSWFSLEAAKKTQTYLLSLWEEGSELTIDLCDFEEEVGDSFTIFYNSQIVETDRMRYKGENVTLIERTKNNPYGTDTLCKIGLPNGEIKEVEIEEIEFGYHLTEEEKIE